MCEQCTRREFLGTAGALGGMAWAANSLAVDAQAPSPAPSPVSKARICVIVAGAPADFGMGFPVFGLDDAA